MTRRAFLEQPHRTGALVALALALVCLAAPDPVSGQTLTFSAYPATVSGTYDPDAGTILAQTITIQHKGKACSYFVTFSAGQSGNLDARAALSGSNALQYQIYDTMTNRNTLKDLTANPTLSEVLTGSFAAGGATQNLSYTVYLPPGQLPPAGTYTDTITMQVHVGTPASPGASQQSVTFAPSLLVNAALDVSLVATGSPFTVSSTALTFDFGVLAAGATRAADLVVRSNSLNTITITSQNGGLLKNPDPLDISQIPYQLLVNGSTVALPAGTPQALAISAPATGFSGARYSISAVAGSYGWATEGSYSDVLTIQAAAN